jgi:5-methylcytosine-specific restriction enzyme subunit McrC
MKDPVQVFEHSTLEVGEQGFKREQLDALARYNDRHSCAFFKVGHERLTFSHFVGVIQVGSLAIEILPKAEKGATGDKGKWQRALVEMLRRAGMFDVKAAPDADLHRGKSSLLDLYLDAFLCEVERLSHAGLVKKYRTTEANLYKLKGRILFRQQISKNLLHRERMYTAHQTYDRDNVFNRILKCALSLVAERLAVRTSLAARAATLSLSFEDISESRVTVETFDRLAWSRNTERYRKAIQLARLIILNYSPDLRYGREHVLAFLFDMNKLFERFILKELHRAQRNRDTLEITGQERKKFWNGRTIRPDIVATFGDGDGKRVILDTKWKIPKNDQPEDDDLKQMYAYNLHFGSHRGVLVYPQANNKQQGITGPYVPSEALRDYEHECATYYVELFDKDELKPRGRIGTDLIDKVICK